MKNKRSAGVPKQQKVYFTYEQQIAKLRSDGLIVENERRAMARLKWEGYYNFAVGYNRLFKDAQKRYLPGVKFEHVEALFDFDKHLRGIVYEYAQQVECNLKALISDEFSKKYGVDERSYLAEENFVQTEAEKPLVRWIIGTCRTALKDACREGSGSYRDYIAYYAKTYRHVPLWALIRALSFGNTSKFLRLMKTDDSREVAREYGLGVQELCNMTEVLVCFRNIAAHGERVYCARLPHVRLTQKLSVLQKLQIPKKADGTPLYGRSDFMACLIVFKYLLPPNEFLECFERLKREVEKLEACLPPFAYRRALEEMGLSGSWKKLDKINV
ncbi:MAG: Abi family protein [Clostridia bacterium]|nr:Abi family protein [Clostridia bacterium]